MIDNNYGLSDYLALRDRSYTIGICRIEYSYRYGYFHNHLCVQISVVALGLVTRFVTMVICDVTINAYFNCYVGGGY